MRHSGVDRELGRSWNLLWAAGLILLPAIVACSGGAQPKTPAAPPQQLPQAAAPEQQPAPAPTPVAPPEPPTRRGETLVVLDDPKAEEEPVGLVEAARRARAERERAETPKVVITNENLSEYATGQVTMIEPAPRQEGETPEGARPELGADEQYWREGVLKLRLELRRAVDEAAELDRQIAGLRLRFYAEDDPYVRDGQIKPAWDEALERQRQVHEEIRSGRRELEEFLEQGREAGALPGWLREGIEHEPEFEAEGEADEEAIDGLSRHRPKDPEVVGEGGGNP